MTWSTTTDRDCRPSREMLAGSVPFAEGFRDQHTLDEAILHDPDDKIRRHQSNCLLCALIAAFIVAVPILTTIVPQLTSWCDHCFQSFADDPLDIVGQIIA